MERKKGCSPPTATVEELSEDEREVVLAEATVVYRGRLCWTNNNEEDDLLGLVRDGETEILAETIRDDIDSHGSYLSVRYWVTASPMPKEELEEKWVRRVCGDASAKYVMVYSETTGYLWTTQDFEVGGHDVHGELESILERADIQKREAWLHMEIKYAKEPLDAEATEPATEGQEIGLPEPINLEAASKEIERIASANAARQSQLAPLPPDDWTPEPVEIPEEDLIGEAVRKEAHEQRVAKLKAIRRMERNFSHKEPPLPEGIIERPPDRIEQLMPTATPLGVEYGFQMLWDKPEDQKWLSKSYGRYVGDRPVHGLTLHYSGGECMVVVDASSVAAPPCRVGPQTPPPQPGAASPPRRRVMNIAQYGNIRPGGRRGKPT